MTWRKNRACKMADTNAGDENIKKKWCLRK